MDRNNHWYNNNPPAADGGGAAPPPSAYNPNNNNNNNGVYYGTGNPQQQQQQQQYTPRPDYPPLQQQDQHPHQQSQLQQYDPQHQHQHQPWQGGGGGGVGSEQPLPPSSSAAPQSQSNWPPYQDPGIGPQYGGTTATHDGYNYPQSRGPESSGYPQNGGGGYNTMPAVSHDGGNVGMSSGMRMGGGGPHPQHDGGASMMPPPNYHHHLSQSQQHRPPPQGPRPDWDRSEPLPSDHMYHPQHPNHRRGGGYPPPPQQQSGEPVGGGGSLKPHPPDVRIRFGNPKLREFDQPIRPEDVVVVPALFGDEPNRTHYNNLMTEIKDVLAQEGRSLDKELSRPGNQFVVVKRSRQSDTCNMVVDRVCEYFRVSKGNIGCSLAVRKGDRCELSKNDLINMERNVTLSVSFGSSRDYAFQCSGPNDLQPHNAVQVDVPQPNNTAFCVGRGVNMRWKVGINSLDPDADSNAVTVSVIVRGKSAAVVSVGVPRPLGPPSHGPPHDMVRTRPRGGGGGGALHPIDATSPHPAKRGRY